LKKIMKINENQIAAAAFAGLVIVALILALTNVGHAHDKDQPAAPTADEIKLAAKTETNAGAAPGPPKAAVIAPFLVKDTDTDSPGTNMVTRIVTFTAEVGGAPPPALQWKVDHGKGFEAIAGATRPTFRIGNAQVPDSGLYSLFATNAGGGINTTPVPLFITEGED
jgi:hypothetical protein